MFLAAACAFHAETGGPPAPPPEYVEAPAPVPVVATGEIDYEPAPPVDDVETYPSVVYEGVPVYYVGGAWYRHDAHGWGAYRHEPPELARQRGLHENEPRWVVARQRHPQPMPRQGVTERQPERPSLPPPAPGAVEDRPLEHRPQPSPLPAAREHHEGPAPVVIPAKPQPRKKATPKETPKDRGKVEGKDPPARENEPGKP
jgi:hypothetical protein